jgi:hypothetical protein
MRWISLTIVFALCACNLTVGQPVTPTPAIPTIIFQFPTNNVAVAEGTDLQIQLLAQDTVGIAHVELMVDGALHQDARPVDSDSVPVFTVDMNWLAEGVGLHAFQATAYRLDGTASRPVLINVNVTSMDATQTPAPG